MKNFIALGVLLLSFSLSAQINFNTGSSELDGELNDINTTAKSDMTKYKQSLGDLFNVSIKEVEKVIGIVKEPAEAHLAFKIGSIVDKPVDDVLRSYKSNKDKGWGAIAKDLGIKPGSAEFHALKGKPGKGNGKGNGNGNSKGKGKK